MIFIYSKEIVILIDPIGDMICSDTLKIKNTSRYALKKYLKNHTSLYSKVFIRVLTYALDCFEQGNFA